MDIEILRFDIWGRNAHFKNPENNLQIEITFEHIPKTVVLGILGAIIGLKGRGQERQLGKIEWWEELKDVEIAIIPALPKWRKSIDETTNTTGFANNSDNQILRRQYLENPKWTIGIRKDSIKEKYWEPLYSNLKAGVSEYRVYLGQTNHQACIDNVELVYGERFFSDNAWYCDSLVRATYIEEVEDGVREGNKFPVPYKSIQYYPIALNELGLYESEKLIHTNKYIMVKKEEFYKMGESIISFI